MDKPHVLVVDDEANARSALAALLRDDGYRVETAAHGLEALDKVKSGALDIVLTDLQMPQMDGLTLLRTLRALGDDGPEVVVMTAFGAVDTAVSTLKEGARDYVTKPIQFGQLMATLDRVMELRCMHREAAKAERQLEAANRDLEAFAGRVAHDLRTPLSPITLLASGLKRHSVDPKVLQIADRIAISARRAGDMIEGLLAFSRLGRHDHGPVMAAKAVIDESLSDFGSTIAHHQVSIETDLDDEAAVACSPSLFRAIVDNLIGNALKHLEGRERRWVRVRLRSHEGAVELDVEDSGPGIPADSLQRIFELFYRVPGDPVPGTGMGLATVRRIVDAHDGQVTVRSVVGQGTSFRTRLPPARAAAATGFTAASGECRSINPIDARTLAKPQR